MNDEEKGIDPEEGNAAEEGTTEFEQLYNQSLKTFQKGSLVKGWVLRVQSNAVLLDLGYKSDGIIPIEQFSPEEAGALKPGDELEVYIEDSEDARGNLILSRDKAKKLQVWDDLNAAFEKGSVIAGKVTSKVKGGLTVDIGVPAFLPASQLDVRPVRDAGPYLGRVLDVRIIKMNSGRGNIVLSHRAVIEDRQKERREQLFASLSEGARVTGTVKNITDYGIFVDLGGVDGLLHVTDLSWGRIERPGELFKPGDVIEAVVLKFDREKGKVSLGRKQLIADPWLSAAEKYAVGSRVSGKVMNLTDYGAFVELEPGIEGLVHVSEMSWTRKIKHPSSVLTSGDTVEAQVLAVDPAARRISLGIRQIEPNPWDTVGERYPAGTVIEGKVRTVTDFGAFVGIEEGIDGLIHVSDLSWTKHITHPAEVLKKGQTTKAVVLQADPAKRRISLGLKQLSPDPWKEDIPRRYKVGHDETVAVSRKTESGLFVRLEHDVEGLIPVSEIPRDAAEFKEGDEVTARVIKLERSDRKVTLSIKAHLRGRDKESLKEFMDQQQKLDTSIGALLKERGN